MFQVKLDDYILYDWRLDDIEHEDMTITNAKVSFEKNKTNSFTFNIASTHRYFEYIKKMKSIVKVYQRDRLIFRGRVLEDRQGFNKTKSIDCEGELAFLLDSVYRPFNLTGKTVSLTAFFTDLIDNHNSQVQAHQRFILGDIEVEDPNKKVNFSSETALRTWDIISDRIINTYGGYLYITYNKNEMPIINYYKTPPYTSTQKIEYGVNLLDISKLISANSLATACIPYGAKIKDKDGNETDERLTIKSVNGGLDYIVNTNKAKEFGIIYANPDTVTFDDVTTPENLLTKANESLSNSVMLSETIELKSADLANGEDIYNFKFLDNIEIMSLPHGFDDVSYILDKLELDLFNRAGTTIVLGETKKTLTDNALTNYDKASAIIKNIDKINSDYVVNEDLIEVKEEVLTDVTSIIQDSEKIVIEALEEYVSKDSFEEYKETVSSEIELTNDNITLSVGKVIEEMNESDREIQEQITELELDQEGVRSTVTDMGNSVSEVVQRVGELSSKISEVADITISEESLYGKVLLSGINESEPIYIKIHPTAENISYLYPRNNLFPSDNLHTKTRTLRFKNTETDAVIDYELPCDLLYYDEENYDEFILNYEFLTCEVNKRVDYNEDGTTYILDTPTTITYDYPKIPLTDGNYEISLLGYSDAYLFVRLMTSNIYTTQFATKVELNSEIEQLSDSINLEVSQKVSEDQIIAKLNVAVKEGQGIIDLIGDIVKITSKYFTLTADGKITATQGNIAGLIMETNNDGDSWLYKKSNQDDGTILENGLYVAKNSNGNKVFLYAGVDVTSGSNILTNANMYVLEDGRIYAKKLNIKYDNGVTSISYDQDGIWQYLSNGNYWSKFGVGYNYDTPISQAVFINDAPMFEISDDLHNLAITKFIRANTQYYNGNVTQENYCNIYVWGNRLSDGVNNSIYIQGYEVATNASDERIKKNIVDSEIKALKLINKIHHKSFDWDKEKANKEGHIDIGYIAQELITIDPNFVIYNKEFDTYQINTLYVLSTSTKAIQELDKKIEKRDKIIEFLAEKLNCKDEVLEMLKEGE